MSLLRLLAFGAVFPMVLGYFFLQPIPLSPITDKISLETVGSSRGEEMSGNGLGSKEDTRSSQSLTNRDRGETHVTESSRFHILNSS
jgi:hypothetical protein